jgi:MSHA biogenesis protein MshN
VVSGATGATPTPSREALATRNDAVGHDNSPPPMQLEKSTPRPSPAERAEAEYRRGIELHERGQPDEAEEAFAAALQRDGRHAPARRALAVEWLGHGRTADAERLLREGLAQNAQQPMLAIVVARIEAERRDVRGAIETLRASLGGSAGLADRGDAQALMATLQQGAGQHRDAIDAYAAALRQSPHNGAWWVGLALSLAAEGRPESAREAFERARASGNLGPELQLYVEQRLRSVGP